MKLKFIFVFLLAGIFGYSSYWFYLSINTGVFLEQATKDLSNQGISFEYTDYSVSGFPYRLEVTMENISIRFQNGPLSTQLVADRMEGIVHPWNFSHIIFLPENSVTTFALGSNKQVTLSPEVARISFVSLKDGDYRLSFAMEKVEVNSKFDFPLPSYFETFSTHIRKQPNSETLTSSLLEPRLLEIALDGTFPDNTNFSVATSFRGDEVPNLDRKTLAGWRDKGGTLEIDSFTFQVGEKSYSGSGSFTLDEELKPLGSLGLVGVSNLELLTFFENIGMLGRQEASFLRDFLETLPNQDKESMPLSLSIQGGFLTLGPARMIEVGSIIQE
ncbi:MAG: DUF2125 domain-containing protein [Sphingomonadales bacterium]